MISVNSSSSTLSYINQVNEKKQEEEEKLASSKRINSAADDPAGLQIASRLTSEINGYQQLSYNAQDQINVNQVQEGALGAIGSGLQRANELAVQSGSPLADDDAIQAEFDELTEQINTVAEEVFGVPNFLSGLDASDPEATQQALESAFGTISDAASQLGADSNALSSQVSTYQTSYVNASESRSRIEDTDYAASSSQQQQLNVLLQASVINQKDEEERKGLLVNQLV
ncbi:flagellin [Thalassotalea euphylliae]|uniref:flagellin n=1 Tax=Thalassotalea euphylliae TaxID=1655234 RepID=UPI003636F9F6